MMHDAAYTVGDRVELALDLAADLAALGGSGEGEGEGEPVPPVTPDDVRLILRSPGGTFEVHAVSDEESEIEHDGGVYRFALTPTEPGSHEYRWVVVGAGQRAVEGRFYVRLSTLAQGG